MDGVVHQALSLLGGLGVCLTACDASGTMFGDGGSVCFHGFTSGGVVVLGGRDLPLGGWLVVCLNRWAAVGGCAQISDFRFRVFSWALIGLNCSDLGFFDQFGVLCLLCFI